MFKIIKNFFSKKIFLIKNEVIIISINLISILIINFFFVNLFLLLMIFISITLALFIGYLYKKNYFFGFGLITIIYILFFIICIIFRRVILNKILKKLIYIFLEKK